jgi:hypothetical protein
MVAPDAHRHLGGHQALGERDGHVFVLTGRDQRFGHADLRDANVSAASIRIAFTSFATRSLGSRVPCPTSPGTALRPRH